MKFTIPHIAFGRLVKPLSVGFTASRKGAGFAPRMRFDIEIVSSSKLPLGSSMMGGSLDETASFNAERYRCH